MAPEAELARQGKTLGRRKEHNMEEGAHTLMTSTLVARVQRRAPQCDRQGDSSSRQRELTSWTTQHTEYSNLDGPSEACGSSALPSVSIELQQLPTMRSLTEW